MNEEVLSNAVTGIAGYLPYVQALCYVLAAVVAVVGAYSVYWAYHFRPEQVRRRILMVVGGALCFVSMAWALPAFFGYESDGSGTTTSDDTQSDGDSYLSSDEGGIPNSTIITELPTVTGTAGAGNLYFSDGTSMSIANYALTLYEYYYYTEGLTTYSELSNALHAEAWSLYADGIISTGYYNGLYEAIEELLEQLSEE